MQNKKPTYILGLNEGQCASAALLKNGEIIAAAAEERFTRVKNAWGFPQKAIKFCLQFAKINASQIDLVVLSYIDPYVHFTYDKALEKKDFAPTLLLRLRDISPILETTIPYSQNILDTGRKIYYSLYQKQNQKKQVKNISDYLKIPEDKVIRMDHHLAHAYTTFYSNPNFKEKETLVLTCDGAGDQFSAAVYIVKNNIFKLIAKTPHKHSLGLFFTAITGFLGMKAHEDEYKVMGLAPYGNNLATNSIIEKFEKLIWLDGLTFQTNIPSRLYGEYLKKHLSPYRFDHIAYAAQTYLEKLLVQWVKNAIKKTGIRTVVFGGGVFLNVKANKEIAQLKEVKKSFFMPSASDDTNAIGAAYFGYAQVTNHKSQITSQIKPLTNLYLGPEFTDNDILKTLKNFPHFKVSKPEHLAKTVAELLAKGEIVARFFGRMEMGARALGNRSILANPMKFESIETINRAIKMRDFWMPFAPTILFEKQHIFVQNKKNINSPFMTLAFDTTDYGKKNLIAAIHPFDKTTRPQILKKENNPAYYEIIKEFEKLTGIGAVLNTSFNIHGEPIVCNPEDALSTLKRSGLQYLIMGAYLIVKP